MSKKTKKLVESKVAFQILENLDSIWPGSSLKMESHVLDGVKPIVRRFFKSLSKKDRVELEKKLSASASKPKLKAKQTAKKARKADQVKPSKSATSKRRVSVKRKK